MTAEKHADGGDAVKSDSENVPESKWVMRGLLIFSAFVVFGVLFAILQPNFLNLLKDTSITRGLITFLVAVVTVSIAIILAVWVLVSNAHNDELKNRFSNAKDILATLVGILGTILGFYFGSLDSSHHNVISVSEVQFKGNQAIVHSSGGVAPYRYTISIGGIVTNVVRLSTDGWLFEEIPSTVKDGDIISIEVVDAKDLKVSKRFSYKK